MASLLKLFRGQQAPREGSQASSCSSDPTCQGWAGSQAAPLESPWSDNLPVPGLANFLLSGGGHPKACRPVLLCGKLRSTQSVQEVSCALSLGDRKQALEVLKRGWGADNSYHLLIPSPRFPPHTCREVWQLASGATASLRGSARPKTLEGGTRSQGLPGWGEVKLSGEGRDLVTSSATTTQAQALLGSSETCHPSSPFSLGCVVGVGPTSRPSPPQAWR